MATEIERKWLIIEKPKNVIAGIPPISIDQGYIAVHEDKTEVRVRKYGNEFWQTIKSPGHISRKEFEISISESLFQDLFALTEGRNLTKNRYLVPFGHHKIEIDEYTGRLAGLWVAEVEFTSIADCDAFVAPDWFGEEITGNTIYKNYYLAKNGLTPIKS